MTLLVGYINSLARRIFASTGSLVAFLIVPQLYLLGATHHGTLLASFNLMPQQFPTALDQILLAGFNVAVVTWIGGVFYNIGLVLAILVGGLCVDALIRAYAAERDLEIATARLRASANLAGQKLGWLKSIGVALLLLLAVYCATNLFIGVVKAGSDNATTESKAMMERSRACDKPIIKNNYRCALYTTERRNVEGVLVAASE